MSDRPFDGVRRGGTSRCVAITRRTELAAPLADALAPRGIMVLALPTIRIDPPADREPLARAAGTLDRFDWVVLTSTNASRALVALRRPPWPATVRVACVGRATAAAVEDHGQRVDLVPRQQHGAGLVEELALRLRAIDGGAARVLLPLSSMARRTVPDGLRATGAEVVEVEAYRTVSDDDGARRLLEGVRSGTVDAVIVTSPSSLTALLAAARAVPDAAEAGAHATQPGGVWPFAAPLVAIGATTAAALRECGIEPGAEAPTPDVPGLVAALDALFDDTQGTS